MHIANASFWENKEGISPDPETTITYKDILKKTWRPRANSEEERVKLTVSFYVLFI